jgi:hypothetical protein
MFSILSHGEVRRAYATNNSSQQNGIERPKLVEAVPNERDTQWTGGLTMMSRDRRSKRSIEYDVANSWWR